MYTYIKLSGREKIGHRYVIQYRRLKVLSPANIKTDLDLTFIGLFSFKTIKYYVKHVERVVRAARTNSVVILLLANSVPSFTTIKYYVTYFKRSLHLQLPNIR